MIQIDTNCAEDFLETMLAAEGLPVVRARLDVGDVHMTYERTEFVIERKTWADLAASICDTRWHEQKSRMLQSEDGEVTTHFAYLIEGSLLDWEDTWGSRMSSKALWAALIKTQARDGIHVFHSTNKASSAKIVAYLYNQLCNQGFCPKRCNVVTGASSKRKRDNIDTPAKACVAMLSVIPGMSADKAADVVAKYPSMQQLLHASEPALAAIVCGKRKMGPTLARRVVELLHAPAASHGNVIQQESS